MPIKKLGAVDQGPGDVHPVLAPFRRAGLAALPVLPDLLAAASAAAILLRVFTSSAVGKRERIVR